MLTTDRLHHVRHTWTTRVARSEEGHQDGGPFIWGSVGGCQPPGQIDRFLFLGDAFPCLPVPSGACAPAEGAALWRTGCDMFTFFRGFAWLPLPCSRQRSRQYYNDTSLSCPRCAKPHLKNAGTRRLLLAGDGRRSPGTGHLRPGNQAAAQLWGWWSDHSGTSLSPEGSCFRPFGPGGTPSSHAARWKGTGRPPAAGWPSRPSSALGALEGEPQQRWLAVAEVLSPAVWIGFSI